MNHDSTGSGLAFLCHPYHRGGVTTWMAAAAREWKRRHHACWFVAPAPGRGSLTSGGSCPVIDLLGDDDDTPVIIAPPAGPSYEFGTSDFRTSVLRRALSEVPNGVPTIVSNDPDLWLAAVQLADRNPVIGVLHADEEAYYALARRYAGAVAEFVAVSSRIARKASAIIDRSDDVAVIPCGIAVGAAPAAARMGDRVLRLVWVGRIDEHQKRVSDLVRIGARLQRRGVDFELRILGDGPDRDALRAAATSAALADRLAWSGWSSPDAVRAILRESDILLLPSNFEGMPVVAMEALAEGCGVVASRVSGIEDYEHSPLSKGCLYVHGIGDVDAATTAVVELASIPRAVRQQRAWTLARSEFAIGVSVDRYEPVVQRAAEKERVPVVPVSATEATSWQVLPRAWWRWVRTWVGHRA